MGNANYNSLQTSLKRTAGRLTLLASYTYGKSMDWASSIQEQVNPFNFRKEYVISAFDLKHNFVVSYNYEMPLEKLFGKSNRLTQGWAISGVTRFSTGLPVTFQSFGDNARPRPGTKQRCQQRDHRLAGLQSQPGLVEYQPQS